jgi:hypothetical protein
MATMSESQRGAGRWKFWALGLLVVASLAGAAVVGSKILNRPPPPEPAPVAAAGEQEVHDFCGACHGYPPPDTFARKHWEFEVRRGFNFFNLSPLPIPEPSVEAVIKYYQDRAPAEVAPADVRHAEGPSPVRFEPSGWAGPTDGPQYSTANVNLVHLFDDKRLDILTCDMNTGAVMALRPYDPSPAWRVLAKLGNPCHAEVIDLDGDGVKDVLVADLGSFSPTDSRCGRVVWLRGNGDGSFTPHTLLEDVGRVADVRAADFRGTGRLDLVVAEFGLFRTGSVLFLENETTDWSNPKFVPRVIDPRHGAIHVPVTDLNGDGKPDFIGLLSQEHETVVAYLNEGGGKFRKETIYAAPHPAYGSSGIQLVDMNGDGHVDVLYTNGDTLDKPPFLRPWHGIQWLENPGDGTFPWKHHPIAPMYGVHRAVAADFLGDGKMGVVAVSFLPQADFPYRKDRKLDAVVYLEPTGPDQFARHVLAAGDCDHVTCAAGDVTGRGRPDLVVGNFGFDVGRPVTVWENLGKRR